MIIENSFYNSSYPNTHRWGSRLGKYSWVWLKMADRFCSPVVILKLFVNSTQIKFIRLWVDYTASLATAEFCIKFQLDRLIKSELKLSIETEIWNAYKYSKCSITTRNLMLTMENWEDIWINLRCYSDIYMQNFILHF